MPYKDFTPVTLTASDVNTYLMKQSVMVFATSAARTAALALPNEGMVTYIAALDVLEFYDGTNWVRAGTPAGVVSSFAGTTAPTGWLLCFGQAISRTTYADLFGSLGTTYGAGDGTTTFNLPDLRGRVTAGKDDMGGTSAARLTAGSSGITGTTLGAAGGAQTVTLTPGQSGIRDHVHSNTITQTNHTHGNTLTGTTTFAADNHVHGGQGSLHAAVGATNGDQNRVGTIAGGVYSGNASWSTAGGGLVIGPAFNHNTPVYGNTGGPHLTASVGLSNAGTTANITLTNGGTSILPATIDHQNTQPTLVLNYIIKV